MEVYTLDKKRRRIRLIDRFESLIWTERWSSLGDFEMVISDTQSHRAIFREGDWVAMSDSLRVMEVENVSMITDAEGRNIIKVSGRSVEKFLDDRSVLSDDPTWISEGAPADVVRQLFQDICVEGLVDQNDILPDITNENLILDPHMKDLSKWRAVGSLTKAMVEKDHYRTLEGTLTGATASYLDSASSYLFDSGDRVYSSVEVKVAAPMRMQTRITAYSGATGTIASDYVVQTPEDEWVTHELETVAGGDPLGYYRFFVWLDVDSAPIGTKLWTRNWKFTKDAPASFPGDNIPEHLEAVTFEFEPKSLLQATQETCSEYDLGFRMYLNPRTHLLSFDIYSGIDRTAGQKKYPAVVFSPEMGNLQNSTEIKSSAMYKNVAYVYSDSERLTVFAPDAPSGAPGWRRRTMLVKAENVTPEMSPVQRQNSMTRQGVSALMLQRRLHLFDGEVTHDSQFEYGVDYNLGDKVEVHGGDGSGNYMRVVEQIFVSDEQGDRSYPTLSIANTITPGSWLSWTGEDEWVEMGTETWADMP